MHKLMVAQIRGDKESCQKHLRRAKAMRMCTLALRITGAGRFVHYRSLWEHLQCSDLAYDLEVQFKKRCNMEHTSGEFPAEHWSCLKRLPEFYQEWYCDVELKPFLQEKNERDQKTSRKKR